MRVQNWCSYTLHAAVGYERLGCSNGERILVENKYSPAWSTFMGKRKTLVGLLLNPVGLRGEMLLSITCGSFPLTETASLRVKDGPSTRVLTTVQVPAWPWDSYVTRELFLRAVFNQGSAAPWGRLQGVCPAQGEAALAPPGLR